MTGEISRVALNLKIPWEFMKILFWQLLVNGIITGSLYAVAGVSWGIIYRTTRIFHFSHQLVFAVAGYVAALTTLFFPFYFGFFAAVGAAVVLGSAIEILLYRNLRRLQASQTTTFLASMGLATAGIALILLFLRSNPRALNGMPNIMLTLGPTNFTAVDIVLVVASWAMIGALLFLLARSRYGKAIRAVGSNLEMAKNLGLNPEKIYLLVFAMGSALFGAAAFLYTARNCAFPTMGLLPFFMSFTAVFLGGISNIAGHALAGLVLGLAETLGMIVLPGEYRIIIVFLILFVVIIIRPEGLLSAKRDR